MFALARIVLVAATFVAPAVNAQAAFLPSVPQAELSAFCQEYGASRVHLATFFMDDGVRLRGHVNCTSVTFSLAMILPPIDEEIAAGH